METNPSQFTGDRNPVELVSWEDAQEFIGRLNAKEGSARYRLPTEAEWEYACRAGTETPRYHHDLDTIAWYTANSNGHTHPVGQKVPNAWGLYDMLGNVSEWCHHGGREYTAAGVVDPTGAGALRVIRGGSWGEAARDVRAADRGWNHPGYRSGDLGFRCVSSGASR